MLESRCDLKVRLVKRTRHSVAFYVQCLSCLLMPSGELCASYIVSVYNNITQFLSSNFHSSVRPLAVDLAQKFSSLSWLYSLSAVNNFLKRCIFTQSAILCLILVFSTSVPPNPLSTQNLCDVSQDGSQPKKTASKATEKIFKRVLVPSWISAYNWFCFMQNFPSNGG